MKIKLILTVIALFIYEIFLYLFSFVESPIRGTANAQQLTDTMNGYTWSKFVANDGLTTLGFVVLFIVLITIWVLPFGKNKNKNKQNA